MTKAAEEPGKMRLDKWLWHTRFFKTRSLAAKMCNGGKIRVNSTLISKAHYQVNIGDTLTFPQGHHIRVVRVTELPDKRGSAPIAQSCYDDLAPPDAAEKLPQDRVSAEKPIATARTGPDARPNPRDRKALAKLRGKE